MSAGGPFGGKILEHFRRPRNYGALPNASTEAEGTNPLCGDRVRVAIALDASGERIVEARFTANACAICVASASLLTERLRGMPRRLAAAVSDDEVVALLGASVPPARRRCAVLPIEAMRRALRTAAPVTRPRRVPIAAILLAAGAARRFGGAQKLLAPVPDGGGTTVPLVRQAVVALHRAGLDRVVVVLGREGERVRASLSGMLLEFVTNDDYSAGMSTSLRMGVRAAVERWPDVGGLLIALGDQPLLDERIVDQLLDACASESHAPIVAPRYRGTRGNPVVFARDLVDELLAITGDEGARDVVERDPGRVVYIDFDSAPPVDVDTPEDLVRFREHLGDQQRDSVNR